MNSIVAAVAAAVGSSGTAIYGAGAGRPKGLLLDFGSVISVSVFERHRETERVLKLRNGTLLWQGPLAPESDPLWQSMVKNVITEREYWQARAEELGQLVGEPNWDVPTMLKRIRQADPNAVVRPEIDALVHAARARGVKIGVLSNELELFYGVGFLQEMRFLKDLDAIVDATHNGILKPDPRAYALAIDAMGLEASQMLFVDDQFRNVAGAWAVGLQTHYFDLRDVRGNVAAIATRLGLSEGAMT